jgi:hypothetical protein
MILLMAALVFMGINFLGAKKPQQWEWDVYIPGAEIGTEWNLYAYDAGGNPNNGNTFEDSEYTFVRVKKEKNPFVLPYSFRLWIDNDGSENSEKIGFRDLTLVNNDELEPSGKCPCSFPPNGRCPDPYEAPGCMESFLENYPHPHTDSKPDYDYQEFYLSIDVDCDIEAMTPDETISPSGRVYICIVKTDDLLPTGSEDLHNIVVNRDVDEANGIIKITKKGDNSWIIEVEDTGAMRFTEAYWGYWGKGKGRLETKKPIRAIGEFRLTATWTRYPK